MKFYSPSDEPLQVGLTSGHMAVIPREGTELAPMFHREAVANGAIPETIFNADGASTQGDGKPMVREAEIRLAITAMLDGDDEGDFNEDGKPNLNRLKAKLGFSVTREEADAAFEELTKAD
ncbi:hypothetical protein [Simplicispira piscis]